MGKYKGLALDLDGTLIDIDIRYVTDVFNRALNCFGRSASQQEATVFWYGHRDRNEIIQEDYRIDPSGLYECLRRMQIEKEELLWVGNGWEDLEAGRNAGVDTRIVYRKHQGFLPPEVVRIDSLDDIKELLGLQ